MAKSNKNKTVKFEKVKDTEFEEFEEDFEEDEEFEDDENEDEETEFGEKEPVKAQKKQNFAYWHVKDKTYKLKLKTKSIELLENKYKTNLINLMGSESSMPPLKIMLEITHEAMKEWHHGVKYNNVVNLFDKYIENGGSQLKFFTSVFINIYIASGFFSPEMAADMTKAMAEAEKMM